MLFLPLLATLGGVGLYKAVQWYRGEPDYATLSKPTSTEAKPSEGGTLSNFLGSLGGGAGTVAGKTIAGVAKPLLPSLFVIIIAVIIGYALLKRIK